MTINLEGLSEMAKRAVRSNMLEGIQPTDELLEGLRQVNRGVITMQAFKENGIARILGDVNAGNNDEANSL